MSHSATTQPSCSVRSRSFNKNALEASASPRTMTTLSLTSFSPTIRGLYFLLHFLYSILYWVEIVLVLVEKDISISVAMSTQATIPFSRFNTMNILSPSPGLSLTQFITHYSQITPHMHTLVLLHSYIVFHLPGSCLSLSFFKLLPAHFTKINSVVLFTVITYIHTHTLIVSVHTHKMSYFQEYSLAFNTLKQLQGV